MNAMMFLKVSLWKWRTYFSVARKLQKTAFRYLLQSHIFSQNSLYPATDHYRSVKPGPITPAKWSITLEPEIAKGRDLCWNFIVVQFLFLCNPAFSSPFYRHGSQKLSQGFLGARIKIPILALKLSDNPPSCSLNLVIILSWL